MATLTMATRGGRSPRGLLLALAVALLTVESTRACTLGDKDCPTDSPGRLCTSGAGETGSRVLTVTGHGSVGPDCATPLAESQVTLWQMDYSGGGTGDLCRGTALTDSAGTYKFTTTVLSELSSPVITLCATHAAQPHWKSCASVVVQLDDAPDRQADGPWVTGSMEVLRPEAQIVDGVAVGGETGYRAQWNWCLGPQQARHPQRQQQQQQQQHRARRALTMSDEEYADLAEAEKRGWTAESDMPWLKRSWETRPDWYSGWGSRGGTKKWSDAPITWLRKRDGSMTSLPVASAEYDYPKRAQWGEAGAQWLKKRAWTNANAEWLKRASANWGQGGMGWLKRAWSNADTQWLKKRGWGQEIPWLKRWSADDAAAINWLKKRGWESAEDLTWIKRGDPALYGYEDGEVALGGGGGGRDRDLDKRTWSNAATEWIKRDTDMLHPAHHVSRRDTSEVEKGLERASAAVGDSGEGAREKKSVVALDAENAADAEKKSWGQAGMGWIKRDDDEKDKKSWGQAGMGWIKRDDDEKDKKNWGQAGMGWIKRDDGEKDKKSWGQAGMGWIKRDDDQQDKRSWGQAGMGWIKRSDEEMDKRNWGQAGMGWIKRDDDEKDKKSWGQAGMGWIKRADEIDKKNWGQAGMGWIKRDADEKDKKSWGQAGMGWIKRADEMDKKNWGQAGMGWIKRDDDEKDKKSWGQAGMGWIKRDDDEKDKKSWGQAGMGWIKRADEMDKKNWGQAGMGWIKRDDDEKDKKSWGQAGMGWIKRADEMDKKNWGQAGMGWIKRDDDEKDKKSWGQAGMGWIKRDDDEKDKKSWGQAGMGWIKRDDDEMDKKSWGQAGMGWIKRKWDAGDMQWVKRSPDTHVYSVHASPWSRDMPWLKRSEVGDSAERRAWGVDMPGREAADKRQWGNAGMGWIKRDTSSQEKAMIADSDEVKTNTKDSVAAEAH